MDKIELEIIALSHSVADSNNYAIVLAEKDGSRKLPIIIGGYEAQAIAVAMEGMEPTRPLTHDLIKNTIVGLKASLKEIIIKDIVEGIFHASLVIDKDGEELNIDARTSDAIGVAVRFEAPIYTYESIISTCGILAAEAEAELEVEDDEDSEKTPQTPKAEGLAAHSIEELNALLDKVLAEEDYEKAAQIRDELNRRA